MNLLSNTVGHNKKQNELKLTKNNTNKWIKMNKIRQKVKKNLNNKRNGTKKETKIGTKMWYKMNKIKQKMNKKKNQNKKKCI